MLGHWTSWYKYVPPCKYLGKADDNVETTPEHKRSNSEKVLPEDNSLGNG